MAAVVLSGCSEQVQRGWLPGTRETTNHSAELTDLWVNSWIAALIVGLAAWAMMLWCMVAYRRRKNDKGYPRQMAYNVPMETLFTVVPIIMVLTLWGFTDRVQRSVDTPVEDSPLTVEVYGKQWAWDFNYTYDGEEKHLAGVQARLDGTDGVEETLPTMYLPVDVPVEFELKSRDVIHSFWVPAFLRKLDMVPGKTNYIYLTPQEEGHFQGKCAELCGEYHSEMLFNVEVVSEPEFREHLATLEDGHLGAEYNRNPNENPDGQRDQQIPRQGDGTLRGESGGSTGGEDLTGEGDN
jgi:cytochrome c oxidase subunit 2